MIGCFRTRVRKQQIIALYFENEQKFNNIEAWPRGPQAANHCALFESETVLKFYNLEARSMIVVFTGHTRSGRLERFGIIHVCRNK